MNTLPANITQQLDVDEIVEIAAGSGTMSADSGAPSECDADLISSHNFINRAANAECLSKNEYALLRTICGSHNRHEYSTPLDLIHWSLE